MAHYLTDKDLKIVSPSKEIKPKTYQLNPEQTLFLVVWAGLILLVVKDKELRLILTITSTCIEQNLKKPMSFI